LIINVNHKNNFRVISSSCVYLRWICGNKFYFRDFMLIDFCMKIFNFASYAQSTSMSFFLLKFNLILKKIVCEVILQTQQKIRQARIEYLDIHQFIACLNKILFYKSHYEPQNDDAKITATLVKVSFYSIDLNTLLFDWNRRIMVIFGLPLGC